MPTDACFLTPPANAGRAALEAHLETLRTMNADDPLVRLAIEDTEALLADRLSDD
tara:strand:+ start:1304 stop:1468 length:165 start_codon:yes stop_codon:yes gene_type:complete